MIERRPVAPPPPKITSPLTLLRLLAQMLDAHWQETGQDGFRLRANQAWNAYYRTIRNRAEWHCHYGEGPTHG